MLDRRALAVARVRELTILAESALSTLREAQLSSDLPLYGSQHHFADFLQKLFLAIQTHLESVKAEIKDDADEALDSHLRTLHNTRFLLVLLVNGIGWIGVAPNLLVSSALSPHLARLASAHMRTTAHVVISPVWDVNYFNIDLSQALTQLEPLLEDISPGSVTEFRQFCLVSIPATEAENVLLHAILYHELGHKVDDATSIATGLSGAAKPQIARFMPDEKEGKAIFKEVLGSWTRELVSDALATAWIGPSALVALTSLQGAPTQIDTVSVTHPSDRTRLTVMKQLMEKTGAWACYGKYLPDSADRVVGLLAQDEVPVMPTQLPPYIVDAVRRAHKALPVVAAMVVEDVLDKTEETAATWDASAEASLDYCLAMLGVPIVPLKSGPEPDAPLVQPHIILLAGWSYLQHEELGGTLKDPTLTSKGELDLRMRHARIVEKALRDVELVAEWKKSSAEG